MDVWCLLWPCRAVSPVPSRRCALRDMQRMPLIETRCVREPSRAEPSHTGPRCVSTSAGRGGVGRALLKSQGCVTGEEVGVYCYARRRCALFVVVELAARECKLDWAGAGRATRWSPPGRGWLAAWLAGCCLTSPPDLTGYEKFSDLLKMMLSIRLTSNVAPGLVSRVSAGVANFSRRIRDRLVDSRPRASLTLHQPTQARTSPPPT